MLQVGTLKDQGLYSKPSVAVHPGALATRTLPQYSTTYLPFTCGVFLSACICFHARVKGVHVIHLF